MKTIISLSTFILASFFSYAQKVSDLSKESGKLQFGMRSTFSTFNDDNANGMGVGGQFRIKLGSRLNTDWFADYITTDIGGLAKRTDYHIGWSVLYYPFNNQIKKGKLTPYILAGHCFDWTDVKKNGGIYSAYNVPQKRFSSAVQSGLGMHYHLADNFDVSLTAQYMLHLGQDINTHVFDNEITGKKDILITKEDLGLEGHLLINLSLNVYIADLWNKKSK
ncbi:MAG: outer membrane beta-barrel protein [Bacteroidetes bacterium]|nr:outer membrane beta-barrel protein [Bacteroidota bacterium]